MACISGISGERANDGYLVAVILQKWPLPTPFTAHGPMVKGDGLSYGVLSQNRHESFDSPSRKNFQQRCDWCKKLRELAGIAFYDSFAEHGHYGKVTSCFVP